MTRPACCLPSIPHSLIAFFQHDGAIQRVDPAATAYGRRSAAFALNISSAWDDIGESAKHIAWTRQFWSAMQPHSLGGGYINFLSEDDAPTRVQAALGRPNYERLVTVKNQYDPTNFFRMNQNIKPTV